MADFNNTEQAALAVISRWMKEMRPKRFQWCCMCHEPFHPSAIRPKEQMCGECFRDLNDDDFNGWFPKPGINCQCFRCNEYRASAAAWVAANPGKRKRDKISGALYIPGDPRTDMRYW